MSGNEDESWLADAPVWRMASLAELELHPENGLLSDGGGDEHERYRELRRALEETIEAFDANGEFGSAEVASWGATVGEVSELRKLLANNIRVEQGSIAQGLADQLALEHEVLARQVGAVEALEQLVEDEEADAKLAKALTRLRDLEQVVRSPNPFEIAKYVIDPPGVTDSIVEGVKMMARHNFDIALAHHGYGDLESLDAEIATTRARIGNLVFHLTMAQNRTAQAEQVYAIETY